MLKYLNVCQQANVTRPGAGGIADLPAAGGARKVLSTVEGHVFVSADTRQKSSFAMQGKLLNT
jgi:hypothetical protein